MANSSRLSLPSITAPAFQRFWLTVDSYSGLKPSRIWEAAVVSTPSVQNRSLMPIGRPSMAPPSPFASFSSDALAIARALSGVSVMKAFRLLPASMAPI